MGVMKRVDENKKSPQVVGATSEEGGKKVNPLFRTIINVLILIALILSIYAALDTLEKNKEIRRINAKVEKYNDRAEELLLKNEQIYLQKVEDNKRLGDVINRLNLQLDQMDSQ